MIPSRSKKWSYTWWEFFRHERSETAISSTARQPTILFAAISLFRLSFCRYLYTTRWTTSLWHKSDPYNQIYICILYLWLFRMRLLLLQLHSLLADFEMLVLNLSWLFHSQLLFEAENIKLWIQNSIQLFLNL
jgi:hypothetical protein